MSEAEKDEKCRPCAPGMVKKNGKCVMPDVTFTSFFMSPHFIEPQRQRASKDRVYRLYL